MGNKYLHYITKDRLHLYRRNAISNQEYVYMARYEEWWRYYGTALLYPNDLKKLSRKKAREIIVELNNAHNVLMNNIYDEIRTRYGE